MTDLWQSIVIMALAAGNGVFAWLWWHERRGAGAAGRSRVTLARNPLFGTLKPRLLATIEPICSRVSFEGGQVVFQEGESGESLFIVLSGRIRVQKTIDGRLQTLTTMKPGDMIGEGALLSGQPRAATAVADGRSTLLRLDRAELDRVDRQGEIRRAIWQNYAWHKFDTLVRSTPELSQVLPAAARQQLFAKGEITEIAMGSGLTAPAGTGFVFVITGRAVIGRNVYPAPALVVINARGDVVITGERSSRIMVLPALESAGAKLKSSA